MSELKKIRSALVSVYHKEGLDPVIKKLHELGVKLISTGGTQQYIKELGIPVQAVEEFTGYPAILGGRVKTLHPSIFGGILARRSVKEDIESLKEYKIPEIDLVIVDLYPFAETVASGAGEQDIIEKIDIGGISLIRAAAKNYRDVLIVSSRSQYEGFLQLLAQKGGETELEDRRRYAAGAFAVSSEYDSQIFNFFDGDQHSALRLSLSPCKKLRYGENPHQDGYFCGKLEDMFEQLQGKEISYNNLLDIDAAVMLISEFEGTTLAILKHNNACGIATRPVLVEAWKDALAADPVSAFGGIIITNVRIDRETAVEMNKLFFEVVIAPAYDDEALIILKEKKNRIILIQKSFNLQDLQVRTLLNGAVVQQRDVYAETMADLQSATTVLPNEQEYSDLLFANKVVKHTKSNTIVLARHNQLLASGVGQTSRVDALRQAIAKAGSFGFNLKGAVMASDAFFPFPDCVEIAHEAGITSVIQPGGSVRDKDSVDYCNAKGMSMVFTGIRHFKH